VRHVRLRGARGISAIAIAIAIAVATTLGAPAARAALTRLATVARLALGLLGLGVAILLGGSGRRLGGFAFGLILLRLLLLRLMLLRRGEAGVDLDIVVEIVLRLGLPIRTRVHLLLGRGHDAEIVLGVLQVVLRHHRVAARLGIARQLQVL